MEAPSWMFTKALSHRQKVMRLYKRCWREVEAYYKGGDRFQFLECRFQLRMVRARFDANKDITDMRLAQYTLADGCRQLWANRHLLQLRFANDPRGGSNWDRTLEPNEGIIDLYQIAEREQFPRYFNRRAQRKRELLDHWHKIEEAWDAELDAIQRELPEENGGANNKAAPNGGGGEAQQTGGGDSPKSTQPPAH